VRAGLQNPSAFELMGFLIDDLHCKIADIAQNKQFDVTAWYLPCE
jgi:hypothetical protein